MPPETAPKQQDNTATSALALMQMGTGYWITQALYTAAKLGVADALKDGPLPVSELAQSVNAHEKNLYRVMRALAAVGVFEESEGRIFKLTPTGTLLRSDLENSMRPVILMMGQEHYAAWGKLEHGVRTGESPFEAVYGMQVFDYFEQNPQAGETFNAAMTALVRNDHSAVVEAYDFGQFRQVVDVGGGHGMLLAAILKRYPEVSGVLFDLPHVTSEAQEHLQKAGVADRCRIESGSFFEAVTEGADAYVLAHIIHDWSDELSTKILQTVHRAMNDDGKVLLVETVVEPGHSSSAAMTRLMDLNMLVMTPGGQERTRQEYDELLQGAGFQLIGITPTQAGISVIEARKKS